MRPLYSTKSMIIHNQNQIYFHKTIPRKTIFNFEFTLMTMLLALPSSTGDRVLELNRDFLISSSFIP